MPPAPCPPRAPRVARAASAAATRAPATRRRSPGTRPAPAWSKGSDGVSRGESLEGNASGDALENSIDSILHRSEPAGALDALSCSPCLRRQVAPALAERNRGQGCALYAITRPPAARSTDRQPGCLPLLSFERRKGTGPHRCAPGSATHTHGARNTVSPETRLACCAWLTYDSAELSAS